MRKQKVVATPAPYRPGVFKPIYDNKGIIVASEFIPDLPRGNAIVATAVPIPVVKKKRKTKI